MPRTRNVNQGFPAGWNEERIWQLAAHYENQTEDEAVAEDEAASRQKTHSLIMVPNKLVPAVRKLIRKHQARA
jgi:hypothetical protein